MIKQIILPISIIAIAAAIRILPHPANVAPIAAMALFGGCYLEKKYAFLLPIIALFVSDSILGFHQSMPFVYGSFLLMVCIGIWLRKRKAVGTILGASVASSLLFFLITNFGFWLTESLYPKTIEGQITAYVMALPFFRNTLLGDLLYTGLFFGGYELALRFIKRKAVVLN